MGGEESRKRGSTGARMLLLRAEGCLLCLSLDVVEGVFEHPVKEGTTWASLDIVDWTEISGVGTSDAGSSGGSLVVVETDAGPIGLRADSCLGVRDISFVETPAIPARVIGKDGRPLCYLLVVEGQPHFMIEPQALVGARAQRQSVAPSVGTPTASPPRAAAGS